MKEKKYVYLLWSDYSFGDSVLVTVHKTEEGANDALAKLFKICESREEQPRAVDGESFETADGKEYYIQKTVLVK